MSNCPYCGDVEARPGGWCPGCGKAVPDEASDGADSDDLSLDDASFPTLTLGGEQSTGEAGPMEELGRADLDSDIIVEGAAEAGVDQSGLDLMDDDEPVFSEPVPPQGATTPAMEWPEEPEKSAAPAAPVPAPKPSIPPTGRGKRTRRGPTDWSSVTGRRDTPPKVRIPSPPGAGLSALDIDEHAQIEVRTVYQYSSVPADEPPLLGILVEVQVFGEPIVSKEEEAVGHVVLALDLSASMRHPDKYPVLREAVGSMLDDLHEEDAANVLLSVVVFSRRSEVLFREVPAKSLRKEALFRAIEQSKQCFGDYTDIPGALSHAGRIAYDQCRKSRTMPVRVYLLTDGKPQDVAGATAMTDRLSRVRTDLHALAFGSDADVRILQDLFAGKRGGTVKSVRAETIGSAFERVAAVAQCVVATRCLVDVKLSPGVVGGSAFRYRPARVRFPDPAFIDGKHFRTDLGTIEDGRKYGMLFEIRPPEREEGVTELGEITVSIPSWGGPIVHTVPLSIPRTSPGSLPGEEETAVRTARDILDALSDQDPKTALRALRLRRSIYEQEKRDAGLLTLLDKAIGMLESTGTLDALAPDDYATLMAHTCTSGSESDLYFR